MYFCFCLVFVFLFVVFVFCLFVFVFLLFVCGVFCLLCVLCCFCFFFFFEARWRGGDPMMRGWPDDDRVKWMVFKFGVHDARLSIFLFLNRFRPQKRDPHFLSASFLTAGVGVYEVIGPWVPRKNTWCENLAWPFQTSAPETKSKGIWWRILVTT